MPTLYIVATPIGNLEDITLRALRVLEEVGLIAAEDTRTTRKLLNQYGIKTPTTSYHGHSKGAKLSSLLHTLRERDVALVSEAGMPGISDPGHELIWAAIEEGIPVVAIPGPSAVTTALAVSGLAADRFRYLGFLPRRKRERRRLLQSVSKERGTLVAFEAPHRLRGSLEDMQTTLGERRIALCRELTKVYEEVFRGTIPQALEHFSEPRGEFTLVIAGNGEQGAENREEQMEVVHEMLESLRGEGAGAREAVGKAARETGLSRREVYRVWLELKARAEG